MKTKKIELIRKIAVLSALFILLTVVLSAAISDSLNCHVIYECDEYDNCVEVSDDNYDTTYKYYDDYEYVMGNMNFPNELDMDEIPESMKIDWVYGDVIIMSDDNDIMTISDNTSNSDHIFRYRISDSTLDILYTGSCYDIEGNMSKNLTVKIPEKYLEKLGTIYINSSSGNIKLKNINAEIVDITSKNGNIGLSGCTVRRTSVNAARADLDFYDVDIGTLDCAVNVGKFTFVGAVNSLSTLQNSGNCVITLENEPNRIYASSAYGNMDIYLSDKAKSFNIDLLSGIDNFRSSFENLNISDTDSPDLYCCKSISFGNGAGTYIKAEITDGRFYLGQNGSTATFDTPTEKPDVSSENNTASSTPQSGNTEDKSKSTTSSKLESTTESKAESKSESKTESKTESKPDSKSESKTESKSDSKAESKVESKTDSQTDA